MQPADDQEKTTEEEEEDTTYHHLGERTRYDIVGGTSLR